MTELSSVMNVKRRKSVFIVMNDDS